MWVEITEEVWKNLKVGDRIKYHDTYQWTEDLIDKWEIDNKQIVTGVGNERTWLISLPPQETNKRFVWR